MKPFKAFILKYVKECRSGGKDMDLVLLLVSLLAILIFHAFTVRVLVFLAFLLISLFIALLATGVLVFLICKGILWSFANTLKMAVEHTAWGFILPWTVLCVLAADLRASLKKAP